MFGNLNYLLKQVVEHILIDNDTYNFTVELILILKY